MTTHHPESAVPDHAAPDRGALGLSEAWAGRLRQVAGYPFVDRPPRAAAADLAVAAAGGRSVGDHVHLLNAWSIASADRDRPLRETFSSARGWNLPDGRPLTWLSRLRGGLGGMQQVRGPQLMLDTVDVGRSVSLRHYLLGSTPETLQRLRRNLESTYPGVQVVGVASPPFRPMTDAERSSLDEEIANSRAQVVWVGLGTPKQDFEARRIADRLPVVAVAVGAAFDYAAGALRPAPSAVRQLGLEWLWRFAAEPRRLWRRYTIGNIRFLVIALRGRASQP